PQPGPPSRSMVNTPASWSTARLRRATSSLSFRTFSTTSTCMACSCESGWLDPVARPPVAVQHRTGRKFAVALAEHLADGRAGEGAFEGLHRLVQPAVQRAEVVAVQAHRAG